MLGVTSISSQGPQACSPLGPSPTTSSAPATRTLSKVPSWRLPQDLCLRRLPQGPLHLLCPLPGTLSDILAWLAPS